MLPLIAQLISSGATMLGGALLDKGKEAVEKKLGIELPDLNSTVSSEKLAELRKLEFDHEEKLLELSIRKQELELQAEVSENSSVSDRWKSDMGSDSWLSKNIRPLVLAYLTAVITMMAFASEWLQVKDTWIDLLGTAYVTVIVAYFGSRGAEKVTAHINKK